MSSSSSRTTSCAPRRTRCASAPADGESLDDLLPETFALVRETSRRTMGMRHFDVQLIGGMVLHDGSIAEMRTGEGKTLTGTLAVVLERAGRQGRPRGDRERLPGPARRGVDEPHLPRARPLDRRAAEQPALRGEARRLRRRHHVRHELRVRLRLPARQHGDDAGREGPARRPPRRGRQADRHAPLRDRRRGRQHPHRRGAHAADHLRRARAGGRVLRPLRQAREADGAGQAPGQHGPEVQARLRGRLRLRVRGEAQDRLGDGARRRQGRALPRHRPPLQGRERPARQPPHPGAEGRVAVQARRRLRRRRRRGEDHRRVHRPHPRRPALVGGPAPGGGGEGGRPGPGGEPDARHDHAAELLPDVQEAGGDDGHGAHRGDRVHEDLQAARRPDPHEPPDGPQGPERPGLQDQGRQVGGGRDARSASATRPASPSSSARSPWRSPRCCPSSCASAASRTRC